jgi:hypothetical protein
LHRPHRRRQQFRHRPFIEPALADGASEVLDVDGKRTVFAKWRGDGPDDVVNAAQRGAGLETFAANSSTAAMYSTFSTMVRSLSAAVIPMET